MAPRIDKREEGLRELASMISDAYRRRAAGEITTPINERDGDGIATISDAEITVRIEPADSGTGYVYTETVSVENFIRNKGRHSNQEK
jgi:hypothetical protein